MHKACKKVKYQNLFHILVQLWRDGPGMFADNTGYLGRTVYVNTPGPLSIEYRVSEQNNGLSITLSA